MSANVGALKLLIDSLIDLSLQGIRYDLISNTLLLLLNDPSSRVAMRQGGMDLTRILHIFTQVDGVDKDPKKDVLDKLIA